MLRKIVVAAAIGIALAAGSLSAADAGTLGHIPLPKNAGALQPPSGGGSSGPQRQPVDPSPQRGGDYSGDSAGGSGGGGYLGDPNHPGHEQF